MLGWLFGRTKQAVRAEDSVWMSRAAMRKGVAREAGERARAGSSVLVLVFRPSELDEWHGELAAHQPERCKDAFKHDALRRQLGKPGSVTIALIDGLPPAVKERTPAPSAATVDILVCGRNDSRKADDAVFSFADQLGPRARVAFHLSLDDPLLQTHAGAIKPLLEKLGMTEDEPISHAWVSRSIAKSQSK